MQEYLAPHLMLQILHLRGGLQFGELLCGLEL